MPRIALTKQQKIGHMMDKKRREMRGVMAANRITQEEVARYTGLSKQTISNQLCGRQPLGIATIFAIEMLQQERGDE